MVEIAVQTEDKYGVKIPDEDLAGLRTVGDAVNYIQKLEAENPEAAAELKAKFGLRRVKGRYRDHLLPPRNGNFPNVVVTSLAATTSIAGDVDATWKGLLNGESGIDVLEDAFIDEYDLPVRIGGHLKVSPDERCSPRRDPPYELMSSGWPRCSAARCGSNAGSPEVDHDRLAVVRSAPASVAATRSSTPSTS